MYNFGKDSAAVAVVKLFKVLNRRRDLLDEIKTA